jgi:hypothetical protein
MRICIILSLAMRSCCTSVSHFLRKLREWYRFTISSYLEPQVRPFSISTHHITTIRSLIRSSGISFQRRAPSPLLSTLTLTLALTTLTLGSSLSHRPNYMSSSSTTSVAVGRSITKVVVAKRQLEGGGFIVRRGVGSRELDTCDPFLVTHFQQYPFTWLAMGSHVRSCYACRLVR